MARVRNSFGEEEWIIREVVARRSGDSSWTLARHHQIYSNTHFIEHDLGRSDVALEPMTNFERGCLGHS